MAWGKAGSVTLTGTGDVMTISNLNGSKFNQYMIHEIDTGGATNKITYNNDTGTKYSNRFSDIGSEGGVTNQSNSGTHNVANAGDSFTNGYFVAISGEEILAMDWTIDEWTAGSGYSPKRKELVWKSTVSSPITRIDNNNDAGGSYLTDSNFTVLGSDLTPASPTVQDGAVFEETDTNKHYLLDDGTWTEI